MHSAGRRCRAGCIKQKSSDDNYLLQNVLFIWRSSFRQLHVLGSELHAEAASGLLPLPHVHSYLSDRDHVLDLVLDQAGGRSCQSHTRRHVAAHPLHAARQLAKVTSARFLHQGKYILDFKLN
jgi:hypothetical protein